MTTTLSILVLPENVHVANFIPQDENFFPQNEDVIKLYYIFYFLSINTKKYILHFFDSI